MPPIGGGITVHGGRKWDFSVTELLNSTVQCGSTATCVLFHMLVLLKSRGVKLEEVEAALAQRTSMSGLEEKASRKRD